MDGRSCETELDGRNLFTGQVAIGIKRAGALLTAQLRNRRNFLCGVKGERYNPKGQAQEYQYTKGVAD